MNATSRAALAFSAAFAVSGVLAAETFPSTYQVPVNAPVLIQGATVLTGSGERLEGADILINNGKIQSIGKGLAAPAEARHRCPRQVGNARHHRHPFALGRLRKPQRQGP